jgi:hypothetical protein
MLPSTPSLHDRALSRLRQLFPGRFEPKEPVIRFANVTIANVRCREKGCVFPSLADGGGLCRGHLADARAEYSLMPSTTSAAITGLSRLIA